MQVDKQPFLVNIIDLNIRKSWFGRMWSIKTKERMSSSMTLA
jgi:hypothetical protein